MDKKRLNWSHDDDYFSKKSRVFEKVFQESPQKTKSTTEDISDKIDWGLLDSDVEYYEIIRNSLLLPSNGTSELPQLISFTCCNSGEGVSTISSNLAVTLSNNSEGRVLFVDTNFQKPSANKTFGIDLSPGLGEILINDCSSSDAIQSSPINNLYILTTGDVQTDPTPKFDSAMFAELLKNWKSEFRFVLFDTPPMKCYGKQCEVNSSVRLASLVDGVILIIETERTRREVAQRVKERLILSKANILGVVLNKRKFYVPRWLYKML